MVLSSYVQSDEGATHRDNESKIEKNKKSELRDKLWPLKGVAGGGYLFIIRLVLRDCRATARRGWRIFLSVVLAKKII